MVYRATPNTVTGYSHYYLGQGREMTVANSDNLKTRVPKGSPEQCRRLETIKTWLKLAYKQVDEANKKNKILYDRKAKIQAFEVANLVYLYNPAKKLDLT